MAKKNEANSNKNPLINLMCEEKRVKIYLIKAGNTVYSNAMNKFSNEKQENFKLFNLYNRFIKGF